MWFGMVSGVGRGMGVLDGVVIVEGDGAVLGVNLRCHMGMLLRSCAEVRESVKLSFGAVSGVTSGIHVLDGVHVPQGKGWILGSFAPIGPLVSVAYFVTEMYSTLA